MVEISNIWSKYQRFDWNLKYFCSNFKDFGPNIDDFGRNIIDFVWNLKGFGLGMGEKGDK